MFSSCWISCRFFPYNTQMKTINIGVLAHVDAGKTTTVEQMLYRCGEIARPGSVDDGDTQTDWLDVERARGISVRASSVKLRYEGVGVNVIDTPGHADFSGEVERALLALDAAVIVVSAVDGVQPYTEAIARAVRAMALPCVLFVNKCDRVGVDLGLVLNDIRRNLFPDVLEWNAPLRAGTPDFATAPRTPADWDEDEVFAVVERDEALALAFLEGERPSAAALSQLFATHAAAGAIRPVVYGAASLGRGIGDLLDAVVALLPGRPLEDAGEPYGLVYKVEHDPKMGKVAHVRLFGGALRNRDVVPLASTPDGAPHWEKVTQIRAVSGPQKRDTGLLRGNDIAAVYGLEHARAGDLLGEMSRLSEKILSRAAFALPLLSVRISAAPEQQNRLLEAVVRLCDEDPLLDYEWNPDERELSLKIMGEIQIEILKHLLDREYGIDASFSKPLVIYRETPTKSGVGFESYTMPKPCWAVVELQIDPLPRGAGYAFESRVRDDRIFYKYQNHIALSVPETLKQGLSGWQVTDLKVTLIGGEHHVQHTHNMDFFLATPIAVMDGLRNCGTTLLEPVLRMDLVADESLAGKLIGDILAMRGEPGSPAIRDGQVRIEAAVPAATSLDYPVAFASLTSGKGRIRTSFLEYRPCPPELGATTKRRGVDPLDRDKWILHKRGAVS